MTQIRTRLRSSYNVPKPKFHHPMFTRYHVDNTPTKTQSHMQTNKQILLKTSNVLCYATTLGYDMLQKSPTAYVYSLSCWQHTHKNTVPHANKQTDSVENIQRSLLRYDVGLWFASEVTNWNDINKTLVDTYRAWPLICSPVFSPICQHTATTHKDQSSQHSNFESYSEIKQRPMQEMIHFNVTTDNYWNAIYNLCKLKQQLEIHPIMTIW